MTKNEAINHIIKEFGGEVEEKLRELAAPPPPGVAETRIDEYGNSLFSVTQQIGAVRVMDAAGLQLALTPVTGAADETFLATVGTDRFLITLAEILEMRDM